MDLFRRTSGEHHDDALFSALEARLEVEHGDSSVALQSVLAALRRGHETGNRLYTSYGIPYSASVFLRVNRNDAAAVLWGWIDEAGYGLLTGGEVVLSEHEIDQIRDSLEAERYAALHSKRRRHDIRRDHRLHTRRNRAVDF